MLERERYETNMESMHVPESSETELLEAELLLALLTLLLFAVGVLSGSVLLGRSSADDSSSLLESAGLAAPAFATSSSVVETLARFSGRSSSSSDEESLSLSDSLEELDDEPEDDSGVASLLRFTGVKT